MELLSLLFLTPRGAGLADSRVTWSGPVGFAEGSSTASVFLRGASRPPPPAFIHKVRLKYALHKVIGKVERNKNKVS